LGSTHHLAHRPMLHDNSCRCSNPRRSITDPCPSAPVSETAGRSSGNSQSPPPA
jgi:hypothetical protein